MTAGGVPGVDVERLRKYFAARVPGAGDAPLSATLIAGGRSNLTYAIGDGSHEWVLRRPPLGHVLPTAHDMAREYRVLAALEGTAVPVPRVFSLCDDDAVNDAPFYVMEKVDGRVLRTPDDLAALDAEHARRASESLVDVLAALHTLDFGRLGLADFGRPEGFCARQVRRWGEQWERSKTAEIPAIDELARRLAAALPPSPPPAIVHGDYRLDNTMLAPDDLGRIVAVLDWEMSTLGDPLTDLGLFLLYWGREGGTATPTASGISTAAGFLSRDAIVSRYAEKTGIGLDHLDWYEVLASYKLAIILAGINARHLMGKTVGEGFDQLGVLVERLAEDALSFASHSSVAALRG